MTHLTRRQIENFKAYTDEMLQVAFDNIGQPAHHRVKATGHIKLRFAKFGDRILAEQARRKRAAIFAR